MTDFSFNDRTIFDAIRRKVKPEILQAFRVILEAVLEDPQREVERAREDKRRRERIQRAERGVKTRRKNQKKKVGVGKRQRPAKGRTEKRCSSSTTRAAHRQYCLKLDGHRGEHSNGFYEWKRRKHASVEAHARYLKKRYGDPSPRVKPARPKTKPKSPSRKSKSK